jgi:tryptophan synthase beta chain
MIETFGGGPPAHRPSSPRPAAPSSPSTPTHRVARHRDLRGGRGRGAGPETTTTPRLGAQPRAAAPDDHRRGGPAQLAKIERDPDLIVGCTGGGSNFAGLSFPFLREKLAGNHVPVIRAVEPASCPSLTQGTYAYDFGDTAGMTPLMKMHTLGHDFIPDPIHAGGLRYHGMSPLISHLYESGLIEAVGQDAARVLRRRCALRPHRGHRPGAGADPRARRDRRGGEAVQGDRRGEGHPHGLCGHGHLDLPAYGAYLAGEMTDHSYEEAEIRDAVAEALTRLPSIPAGPQDPA